jgi:hypothetical protein
VARFAQLVEDRRTSEARALWIEGSETSAIEAQFESLERFELEIGDPGRMDGAAGSSFIDFPLQATGRTKLGDPLILKGTATLRRVNDVPGSTKLQRRWHIYRVELQPRS